ncbi:hypothetical protein PR048_030843 [Dryococelus australis]|uniref:Uncharacterized protein n=1 Tax=Dryococelus australis TaxID=614101 RepID=A0ABQ9GA54_9NEOP|nr:hypothetical protein PR048_030843 [Dryococelus australis]
MKCSTKPNDQDTATVSLLRETQMILTDEIGEAVSYVSSDLASPFTVTSYFSEAVLEFYFQDIPPPHKKKSLTKSRKLHRRDYTPHSCALSVNRGKVFMLHVADPPLPNPARTKQHTRHGRKKCAAIYKGKLSRVPGKPIGTWYAPHLQWMAFLVLYLKECSGHRPCLSQQDSGCGEPSRLGQRDYLNPGEPISQQSGVFGRIVRPSDEPVERRVAAGVKSATASIGAVKSATDGRDYWTVYYVKTCTRAAMAAGIRVSVAPVMAFPALHGHISYLANHVAVSERTALPRHEPRKIVARGMPISSPEFSDGLLLAAYTRQLQQHKGDKAPRIERRLISRILGHFRTFLRVSSSSVKRACGAGAARHRKRLISIEISIRQFQRFEINFISISSPALNFNGATVFCVDLRSDLGSSPLAEGKKLRRMNARNTCSYELPDTKFAHGTLTKSSDQGGGCSLYRERPIQAEVSICAARGAGMKGRGETGDPRENPPTSGIVRDDSHVRESRSDPAGNRTRCNYWRAPRAATVCCCECLEVHPRVTAWRPAGRTAEPRGLAQRRRKSCFRSKGLALRTGLKRAPGYSRSAGQDNPRNELCSWRVVRETRRRKGASNSAEGGEDISRPPYVVPIDVFQRVVSHRRLPTMLQLFQAELRSSNCYGFCGTCRDAIQPPYLPGGGGGRSQRRDSPTGTIHTCEGPGATPPGIEPGSPWREVSCLPTTPPWPLIVSRILTRKNWANRETELQIAINLTERWRMLGWVPNKGHCRFLPRSLFPVQLAPSLMTSLSTRPTSTLASHQGEPGSIPGIVSPVPPYSLQSPSSLRAADDEPPSNDTPTSVGEADDGEARRLWSGAGMEAAGETGDPRENPPTSVVVGTIPTCENPGVTRPGIEPGSPRRAASRLTTRPPHKDNPHFFGATEMNPPHLVIQAAMSALGCSRFAKCVRELLSELLRDERTGRGSPNLQTPLKRPPGSPDLTSSCGSEHKRRIEQEAAQTSHNHASHVVENFKSYLEANDSVLRTQRCEHTRTRTRTHARTSAHAHAQAHTRTHARARTHTHYGYSVTTETLHALRVGAMRRQACVQLSPVSLPRFLTLDAQLRSPLTRKTTVAEVKRSASLGTLSRSANSSRGSGYQTGGFRPHSYRLFTVNFESARFTVNRLYIACSSRPRRCKLHEGEEARNVLPVRLPTKRHHTPDEKGLIQVGIKCNNGSAARRFSALCVGATRRWSHALLSPLSLCLEHEKKKKKKKSECSVLCLEVAGGFALAAGKGGRSQQAANPSFTLREQRSRHCYVRKPPLVSRTYLNRDRSLLAASPHDWRPTTFPPSDKRPVEQFQLAVRGTVGLGQRVGQMARASLLPLHAREDLYKYRAEKHSVRNVCPVPSPFETNSVPSLKQLVMHTGTSRWQDCTEVGQRMVARQVVIRTLSLSVYLKISKQTISTAIPEVYSALIEGLKDYIQMSLRLPAHSPTGTLDALRTAKLIKSGGEVDPYLKVEFNVLGKTSVNTEIIYFASWGKNQ